MGENGLFVKASRAKEETKIAAAKEKIQLRIAEIIDEKTPKLKIEDLIKIENEEIEVRKNEDKTVYSEMDEEEKQYALATCDGYTFKVYPNGKVELYVDKEIVNITFKRKKISEDRKQIDILVTITGNKGLKKIIKPDKTEIYPNNNTISLDYTVDAGVDYTFIAEGKEGTEVTKVINTTAGDIYTIEDLENMSELLTENYRLMNDLDFEDKGSYATQEKYEYYNQKDENGNKVNSWLPIGNSTTAFTGSFDGNYNTISNLYINTTESNQGLFGVISGSTVTIKDLKFDKAKITTTGTGIGVLVGTSNYSTGNKFERIAVLEGELSGEGNIGGIAGNARNAINECYANINATGKESVGGIVGWSNSGLNITNCYSVGEITGIISDHMGGAGIAGGSNGNGAKATNCYSVANVSGTFVGALAPNDSTWTIEVNNSYWTAETAGIITGLGNKRSLAALTKQNTFENWNFDNTWSVEEGITTPYLQWLGKTNEIVKNNMKLIEEYIPHGETMEGAGTKENPYKIKTVEQLEDVRLGLESNYILENDLDLSSKYGEGKQSWTPLGNATTAFTGSFDGNYHTISNLYINSTEGNQGLFGYQRGTIKNLKLDDVNVSAGQYNVGGLVGYSLGNIEKIYLTGIVRGLDYVGGVVGMANGYQTFNQIVSNTLVSGRNRVGGITGNGRCVSIYNSYAMGEITGTGDLSGGVAGVIEYATIQNCYSIAKIKSTGERSGGITGVVNKSISNYWDTKISGCTISAAGVGKTTEEMKKQSTYTDWDFDTIWNIDEGITTPYLRWLGKIN